MKIVTIVLLLFCATFRSQVPEPIDVTYRDLAERPSDYVGKVIRFTGDYRYGFEWAYLCDSLCRNRPTGVWVNFSDNLCTGSEKKLRAGKNNKFDTLSSVVFIGRLDSGGYGHMGAYPFRIYVTCVQSFTLMSIPREL